MILHLVTDEHFADYVLQDFSAPDMHSEIVLIPCNEQLDKVLQKDKMPMARPGTPDFQALLQRLGSYKAIVFHGLFNPWCEQVLEAVPSHVKIAWVFWNGEIYSRPGICAKMLAPGTRLLYRCRKLLKNLRGTAPEDYFVPLHYFRRIGLCLTDVQEEYQFVKDVIGNPRLQWGWYNYYSLEETVGPLLEAHCAGDGILVGNSASIECNHLESFWALRRKDLRERQVYVPLSYGMPWVRNYACKIGQLLMKSHFYPLLDYLPRTEYNRILCSCPTVIMAHWRPNAMGNCIAALWLGARLYMSEHSDDYRYFKRIGITLFSVERDLKKGDFSPLPEADWRHNQQILREIYARDAKKQKLRELVTVLDR
ncbi:MAG: hypothetical protein J5871_05290 [Bacteroidales bacterium]|nr:hypothetical protein [Bacteroidales bacterium]